MNIASPCTGICKLDQTTGWCLGCGRSGDEIADWGIQSETWRDRVLGHIPDRLQQLGVTFRRLPWTAGDIHRFVIDSLEAGRGTWVMGVVGAVAEFTAPANAKVDVQVKDADLVAHTPNGAMQIVIDDHVRALAFDPPDVGKAPRIVLAVKRERGRLPVADGTADLGQDQGALFAEPGAHLFDLGLGRKEARFCVRVAGGQSRDALTSEAGLSLADSLPRIGAALLADSPTRVVETALGRMEVQGRIPPPDARSPDGPHTHLLPGHLASGRALPVGMDLPRAYLPGAIF
ncbi:MAG: DUF1289 domain-containing protein, partial [Pseudomonadota bacterium]